LVLLTSLAPFVHLIPVNAKERFLSKMPFVDYARQRFLRVISSLSLSNFFSIAMPDGRLIFVVADVTSTRGAKMD